MYMICSYNKQMSTYSYAVALSLHSQKWQVSTQIEYSLQKLKVGDIKSSPFSLFQLTPLIYIFCYQAHMKNCPTHHQPIDIFCFSSHFPCQRVLCYACYKQENSNHMCVTLDEDFGQLKILKTNCDYEDSRQLFYNFGQLISKTTKQLKFIEDFARDLIKWKKNAENQITQLLAAISLTFTQQEFDRCSKILEQAQKNPQKESTQELDEIARHLRILKDFKLEVNKEEAIKESFAVVHNLQKEVQNLRSAVNSIKGVTTHSTLFRQQFIAKKASAKNCRNRKKSQKPKMAKKMNEQSEESQNQKPNQNIYRNSLSNTKKERKNEKKESKQLKKMFEKYSSKNEIESHTVEKGLNFLNLKAGPRLTIQKREIFNFLQSCCPPEIQYILISGKNQFDEQCLSFTSNKFTNLKKLVYLHDFPEIPSALSKDQFAYEKIKQYCQKVLPSTQAVFDEFSKLVMLQNMCIGFLEPFQNQSIEIKNKQIRNLTIGRFYEEGEGIPVNLLKQIIKMRHLQTLNLINIKNVPTIAIQVILKENKQLKRLIISSCTVEKSSDSLKLESSHLQTIVFEGSTFNKFIFLPNTLKYLIVQNTSCKHLINLKENQDMAYFSLSYSQLESLNSSKTIQKLSTMNKGSLRYLNMDQQNLTDKCLQFLVKLSNLQHLSLASAKISLFELLRAYKNVPQKIQSLDLVDIEDFSEDNQALVMAIGQIFPKLRNLSINYSTYLNPEMFQSFNNLQSLTLNTNEETMNLQSKKQMKKFCRDLKEKNLGLRIQIR